MLTRLGIIETLQRAQSNQRRWQAIPDPATGTAADGPMVSLSLTSQAAMSNVYPFEPSYEEQRRHLKFMLKPVEKRDFQELQAAKRETDRRRMELAAGNARIPAHYVGLRFDDYRIDFPAKGQDAALQACRLYVSEFETVREQGSNLIFSGTAGTGKTALGCIILQRLFTTGYSGLYVKHEALRCHIRAAYDLDAKHTEQAAIEAYIAPELLVIDELEGAKGNPDTIRKDLHRVIDDRYSQNRPTIIISNMNPTSIRLYLGTSLWDRMTSKANDCRILRFDWPSHRVPH